MASPSKKSLFRPLAGQEIDSGDLEASEVESLCMSCGEMVRAVFFNSKIIESTKKSANLSSL